VPVRQIECHERGGAECVPDSHIVGDLRERDERHEAAEHGEERRRQPPMPKVEKDTAQCREHEHIRRPDEKVIEDQRAIPVLLIRPRIEKRKGKAPEQPGHHRPERDTAALRHMEQPQLVEHNRQRKHERDIDEHARCELDAAHLQIAEDEDEHGKQGEETGRLSEQFCHALDECVHRNLLVWCTWGDATSLRISL